MTSNNTKRALVGTLVASCLVAAGLDVGCDGLLMDMPSRWEPTVDVSGEWTLTGSGIRSGCDQEIYDGPFSLRLASRLLVTQTRTAGDDVERLQIPEPVQLEGSSLYMNGGVQGNEVQFTLREERDGTVEVDLRFSGLAYATSSTVEGDFSGEGSVGCLLAGSFTVDVQAPGGGVDP